MLSFQTDDWITDYVISEFKQIVKCTGLWFSGENPGQVVSEKSWTNNCKILVRDLPWICFLIYWISKYTRWVIMYFLTYTFIFLLFKCSNNEVVILIVPEINLIFFLFYSLNYFTASISVEGNLHGYIIFVQVKCI